MPIYAVRSTAGQEHIVAKLLYQEVRNRDEKDVYSISCISDLKGYVVVEAENPSVVVSLIREIPKAKGMLLRRRGDFSSVGEIPIEELEPLLKPVPLVKQVSRGDLVEIIAGPFKKEKARVAKVDEDKDEITVELIEAPVPIPVVVKGYDIRVLKKAEEEG